MGDDGIKVIRIFSKSEDENKSVWRVVMSKMEGYCIGEVKEIYERYCFNRRDKFFTEFVDNFIVELKIFAKICNFCD